VKVELVLRNGRVFTGGPGNAVAEAVAIPGDRVVAVGAEAEVCARRGEDTPVIDL
jgi:hypothetical protein